MEDFTDGNKYLLDEHPLIVLPTLACVVGLNEALVLQQVHYWTKNAARSKRKDCFRDGRWWVYNTYKEWQENFPFWSIPTIKRTFQKLDRSGLLISRMFRSANGDRTKWYCIDYEQLKLAVGLYMIPPSDQNDPTIGSFCVDQEGIKLIPSLTDTTDTNTETLSNFSNSEDEEEFEEENYFPPDYPDLRTAPQQPAFIPAENKQEELSSVIFPVQERKPLLEPSTPGEVYLFEKLRANARAINRAGPKRFSTIEVKEKFDAAEVRLGSAITEAVDQALSMGINSIPRITCYVAKYGLTKVDNTVFDPRSIATEIYR